MGICVTVIKEEKAKQWCKNIKEAKGFNEKIKIKVCNKIAKKMIIIFISLLIMEFIFLYFFCGGIFLILMFNWIAKIINNITKPYMLNNMRGVIIALIIVIFFLLSIPIIIVHIYKKKMLVKEFNKLKKSNI